MSIFNKYPYLDFHEMNLDMVLKLMKDLGVNVEKLEQDLSALAGDLQSQIDYLTNWVNNYSDAWARSVIENYLATMIFTEINPEGYIVYYIPDSWDEIRFNTTDLDISVPGVDYGHLVLSY